MLRSTAFLVAVLLILMGCPVLVSAQAQTQSETGAICVATFADTNVNGQRDPDETALAGVNVNLVTGNVIIATHITEEGETGYCFENLLKGTYTVVFTGSPLYRATTGREGTFPIEGQRLTIDPFGAFPVPLENLRSEVAAQNATREEPFDAPTRLMLATGGSMMVMLFMVGIGAVVLGLLSGRRPRQATRDEGAPKRKTQDFGSIVPPSSIKPPNR